MTKAIYSLICMIAAPILLVIALGGIFTTVYRGEVIQGLQAELLKNTKQDIKIIIDKVEAVNAVGEEYADSQTKIINERKEILRENIKIVEVPIFNTICISDDGVRKYNETFGYSASEASATSEPNPGM